MNEALALVALAVSLTAAVARWRRAPDWAVATAAAVVLVLVGAISFHGARTALGRSGRPSASWPRCSSSLTAAAGPECSMRSGG